MNRSVLSVVLLALVAVALSDEMLWREKRQTERRYNRPARPGGYGNNFGNNNYGNNFNNRPGNNFNHRPSNNFNSRPGNNFNNRPSNNFNNRPGSNYGNNQGSGLNYIGNFGQPGAPVSQVKPPHHPAIGALFGALLNAHGNNNNNNNYGNNYGTGTQSPTFVYKPVGQFGRPEFGVFSETLSLHVRNKDKNTGKVAV